MLTKDFRKEWTLKKYLKKTTAAMGHLAFALLMQIWQPDEINIGQNKNLTWLIRASRIFSTLPLLMMFVMNTFVSFVELIIVSKNELLITVLLMLVLLMKVEFTVIAEEASFAFKEEISSVISPMRLDISWISLESPWEACRREISA